MSKQVTVKLDEQLAKSLDQWMELNNETNRSQIIIKALKTYISTDQTLKAVEVRNATMEDLEEHIDDLMDKHKDAMDLLK